MRTKSSNTNMQIQLLIEKKIPHQIINIKTLRLTLKFNREGILIIRRPVLMTMEKVECFIEKHLDWILTNYEKSKPTIRKYETGEPYLYLGKTYKLKIIENKYEEVIIQDDLMYVYVPKNKTPVSVVGKWKKEESKKIFSILLLECFKEMSCYLDKYPTLEIKKYVARWGTCYPKKNTISLNISLIHVDIDLIKYVIIHELSHFVYLNHSKNFHSFVRKFMPDETKKIARLKKYKCYYE